jgi:hypothetical protein
MWDKVAKAMTEAHSGLRFYVLTIDNNHGFFDRNKVPSGLELYIRWYPMLLCIPGPLWDKAMREVGTKTPVSLKNGSKIYNGAWMRDDLEMTSKYDRNNISDYTRWIRDCVEDDEFKSIQVGDNRNLAAQQHELVVRNQVFSNIVRPNNGNNMYIHSNGSNDLTGVIDNVCSMRIIEKRRGR